MAEMAPGSAFLQANPYAPAPESAQSAQSAIEGVEKAAPVSTPTPSTDPVVASWKSDPAFLDLPPERQNKIATNYFQKNIADGEFQALPPDRQAKIIQNFMSVNLGGTGYVRAPVNPVPRAPVSHPGPITQRNVGFTPEQSAMFGPAARDKQDIEEAGRSAAVSPAIMDATAVVGSQEAAKQKINDESLLDKPQQFGPQTTVTEGPAGQFGPEYDENGKRNVLRDAYHAANMGKLIAEDAMAGLAGAGFGRESATAKYYRDIADKTAGQTGIDPKSNIAGIGVLDTMRGTAQMAGDMALLVPSGMAVSAAAQPAFSLLRPAAAAAMAGAEGQLAARIVHGAATGAVYSLPQDPKTAWENIKLFAAFEAAAAGAHALGQYGGREFGALTKHIVKTTGVPDKVYFSPTKVRDIMGASADVRGGVSPEEYAIFQDMQNYGLKNSDIIKATREGLTIELPTEMALKIADKPYYAKIKEAFGVEPYARTLESEMSDPRFYTGQGGSMKPEPAKDATLDLMSPVPGAPKALPGAGMPQGGPEVAPPPAPSGPQQTVPVIPGEGVPNGQVQEVLEPEGNGLPGQAGAGVPEVGRPGYGGGLSGGVPQQGPIVAGPGPQGPLVQQGQQPVIQAEGPAPVLGQPADAAPGFTGGQEVVGQAEPVAVPGVGQQPAPGVPAGQPVVGQQPAPVEPAFHPDIHEHVDGTPEPAPVEEYEAPAEPARPMSKEERAYRKGVLEQFQESQKNNPIHRLSTKLRLGYDPLMESPPDRKSKDYKAPHGLNLDDAYRAFGKQALEGISPGLLKKNSPVMVDDLVEWWGLDGPDQVLDALRYNKGKAEQTHMDGVPRFEAGPEAPATDYYDDIPFGSDEPAEPTKPKDAVEASPIFDKDVGEGTKVQVHKLTGTAEGKYSVVLRDESGNNVSTRIFPDKIRAIAYAKKLAEESIAANEMPEPKVAIDKPQVKGKDVPLPKEEEPVLDLTDEVKPPVAPAKGPGVVKPASEPQKTKPVVSKTLKDAGLVVTEKLSTKTGKTYWEISGKTYANKDVIKALPGVKFGGKVWRAFDADPTAALEQALADAEGAKAEKTAEWEGKLGPKPKAEAEPKTVGGRGLGGEGIGIQIKTLRQKLDAMPSIAPVKPGRSVGDPTRALIQKGEGAIPQEVLNAQVEDIGNIAAAFRVGKSAFVLASDPGMGKTFVIAGALKEIARNHVGPLMWVTQNRRLIEQIKADIEPFGLNNRLQFITYTDMSQIHAGKKTSDMKIDGAVIAWDEGHSVKNTSDAGEESGAARADLGQKYMQRAKFNILASATPFENPTQMGYIAASGVFDQLTEMTGLGRAISGTPFSDFALAFGAGQRKIRVKGGREKQILEWERGQTPAERKTQNENAMAARQWLEKQGMLAQREMKLEPGMVTTELKSVPPTEAQVTLADRFTDAMGQAVEEAGADRMLRRNLAGYMTNTLKRIMEDAKVDAAVAEAKDVIAQGKQAVIFVETRAKKEISGKDYPVMQDAMDSWHQTGEDGKPPYSKFQMAVAQALHEAGLEESLESTVKRITEGVGADKTAIFTGDRTENAANADLDLWLDNKKPLLVATMAKGGTGLSLHSRRPGDPERVLIGLNMPWTATVMKQVLGRVTRLGMLKPSEVRWLFLDHDFERVIAAKVGGRMQDMGAVVSGKVPDMGRDIERFDFDASTEGDAVDSAFGNKKVLDLGDPLDSGELQFQKVWHGSPYRFDKFTLDHIGKGEGAQAYGWGLYFAGDKQVAEYYRETLTNRHMGQGDAKGMAMRVLASDGIDGDIAKAITELERRKADAAERGTTSWPEVDAAIQYIKSGQGKGQLYEVTIPDDDTMLDWDKPLSEQPEQVKKALAEDPTTQKWLAKRDRSPNEEAKLRGSTVYGAFAQKFGSDRAASEYLKSIGIPGLRYLDGTSRGKGEGHHNYVVFDDADIFDVDPQYAKGGTNERSSKASPAGEGQLGTREGSTGSPGARGIVGITGLGEGQGRKLGQTGKQKALTTADVQAEVDKIASSKFPHTMVEVVPTWVDLPAEISMGIQRAMATDAVEALYDPQTKKMYILADRMRGRSDVAMAVVEGAMHENLHRGVDAWRRDIANSWGGSFKLANERIDGALNNAYDANKDAVDDLAEGDYSGHFDMSTRRGRARATEEWFARQANQKGKWYDRFVAAMRDFLRKVMEKLGHALKWTDVETRAFISRAHRASKRFEQHDSRVNEAMGRNNRETLREMAQRTRPDLAENLGQVQFALLKNPLKGMTEGERTFALQVHELYDRAMLDVNVSLKNLQKRVQVLAGVSHDSTKARRLDMAMLIYRDLKNSDAAHVKNPLPVADRILAFKRWAAAELRTRKGDSKLRLQEFLRDLEQAQSLTQDQRDFVDQDMEAAFRTTTLEFQRLGKLKGQPIKDYVFRKLTPPDDRPVESSGAPSAAGSPVKSFSTGLMRRKYPTLLDAMQDGYELAPEVRGITNSWKEITTDAVKIAATTRFLQDGMSTGVLSTKNPGDWLPLRSPSLKVWRPTASVKTIIRDNPGLHDTLAAKNDVIGNYSRRLFVTQPEVTWAVFSGQGRRAAAVFDDEADARLYATQLQNSRVEYREGLNVFEKVPFYAPPAIANAINLMTAQQAGKFFSKPLGKSLTYLNGTLKPWMLLGDFFHHQSLMRSWTFGGPHDILGSLMYGSAVLDAKGRPTAQAEKSAAKRVVGMLRGAKNSVSWRKAILSGLELIEERNPIIQKLVGKGLTFPSMADMTGHNMTKAMGIFETLVRALGSQRAADAVAVGKILRSRSEHFLFATIDAGFKAQWAYTYFMHQLRHEISRGGTPDVEKIAEIVADAANTAFGGQHLGRAGRDPDLTKFLHLIMLAPDWAITQLKPAFAAVPGLDKVIARVLGEMPPPPGRDAFYRVFLAKQLLAAAVATLLAQVLINGDSEEGPFQMYREQMSDLPTAARLRWAMVDVTRMYRKVNEIREGLGLEPIDIEPGTRYMFNLPGFMIAPLRLFELGRFIAAKGSPLVRVITPYVSGADWRDRPYKSVGDLKKGVDHLDRKSSRSLVKGTRDENPRDISQFPAILMANVRDAQPLQIGQMLRWLQGEEDGLTATIKSLGVDFTVARDPRTNYKKFMEISKLSGEEYKEIKQSIYKKDYDPNKLPENDVEAYAAVALKSAIHKTRVQASKIREAVEEAKLNPDYTNEARRRRVEMLKKTEDQMYKIVVLYHKAYTEGMKRHTITVTPEQVEQLRKDLAAEE